MTKGEDGKGGCYLCTYDDIYEELLSISWLQKVIVVENGFVNANYIIWCLM